MKDETATSYKERILRVLIHIQSHLDEEIALEDLADVACFSPYHFHRIFSGMIGESVKEHIRRLRLERAAQRLRFTGQPVIDIALGAGYDAHEAFTRAFRQMFDESPQEFRKRHRPLAYGPTRSGVHFSADGGGLGDFSPVHGGTAFEAQIETLPATTLAFVRHTGPYDEVGRAWQQLMVWAGARGLLGSGLRLVAVVHDDPVITPPGRVRYDAGIVVGSHLAGEGDVGLQTIEEGRFAVARHRGRYDGLGATYARLCGEWAPRAGHELRSAPALEVYLNSPGTTAPENLLTDVYVPVVA